MTSEEFSTEELRAVADEQGVAGLVRFLLHGKEGKGDYTGERDSWLPTGSVDEVIEQMEQMRQAQQELESGTGDRSPEFPGGGPR